MAAVPDSRSGAGGKMVTTRRRQRLAAKPYDRPLLRPPPKSPNWFTGVVIPSARALASGAGKFISSTIFSDSESSSSEDIDSASDNDVGNVDEYESPGDGVDTLNEEKMTSQYGRESQLGMQGPETKWLIEQLIMHENFSREECDWLTKVLNSRVKDPSLEAGDKRSLANSPRQSDDHEDPHILNKAVLEAKKWLQEKKGGSKSVADLVHVTYNPNSTVIDHMESGVGSPVDMARSYMRERPPWASPIEHVELRTPLTTKLFKEQSPYSVTKDVLSSSKIQTSLASGSWNIQEELRKVRSKAVEDMLRTPRTPPAKNDSSWFAVAATTKEFIGTGEIASSVGEELFEPYSSWRTKPVGALMDVGVIAEPSLIALGSKQDGEASEAPSMHLDTSTTGIHEDPETIPSDGGCAPSTHSYPASPAKEQHSADPHSTRRRGSPEIGLAEFEGRLCTNGSSPVHASLSAGEVIAQIFEQYDEKNHNDDASYENQPTNGANMDGNCEPLSEACMKIPINTETDGLNNSSQISLDVQNEDSVLGMLLSEASAEGQPELTTVKPQARKVGKNTRRSRGRGK